MAITAGVCYSAKEQFLTGSHTPLHTYKIALYQSPATVGPTSTVYTTSGEVTGSGYTAGGVVLSGYSHSFDNSGGAGYLHWTVNPTLSNASFTARGAMIYNTSGSSAISVHDFGADFTSTSGTFTIPMPTPDGTHAVVRVN